MDKVDAVIAAAKQGDVDRVSALLEENPALATAANMFGSQPIHAAYLSGHQAVVELRLARGVSLDASLAAELGMLDRVEQAVRADPDLVKAFGPTGTTLLHWACYWCQVAVSRLLLANGADANAATHDSFLQIRPLGCAVATPERRCERPAARRAHRAAYRGHLRVMRYLIERGADAGIRGYEGAGPHAGQTAADLARAQGQREAVSLLAS